MDAQPARLPNERLAEHKDRVSSWRDNSIEYTQRMGGDVPQPARSSPVRSQSMTPKQGQSLVQSHSTSASSKMTADDQSTSSKPEVA